MFTYDSSYHPPAPVVQVRIKDHRRAISTPVFAALLDSGADCSAIPLSEQDQRQFDYEVGQVEDFTGQRVTVRFIRFLRATVELLNENGDVMNQKRFDNLRLFVGPEGLLGRDILNSHICELNGPASVLKVH